MNPRNGPSRQRCVNCGTEPVADPCSRCGRPLVLPVDYLSKMEDLTRRIVQAAIEENSFDVFSDDDARKTPLQREISRAANQLLNWHYPGDGCVDHGPEQPGTTGRTAPELRRLLLEAVDRIDDEVVRKNWGYETPSPRKLIREGLRIAKRCIEEVPLDQPAYLEAVQRSLQAARDRQDACGVSDDGWKDEDGYILSGIWDAYREAEKLKTV